MALAAGFAVPEARSDSDRIHLLPSGPSVVHFVVDLPPWGLAPVADVEGAPSAVRIEVDGYETVATRGEPALPVQVLMVAVPPRGDVRVRAQGIGADVREGVTLAPQPTISVDGAAKTARSLRSLAAYASEVPRAPARATLLGVSWMRNQRVAKIAIAPAEYEPSRSRLTVWSQIDVQVEIEGAQELGLPVEPRDPFENLYRDVLVNYEQGRAWRRTAESLRSEGAGGGGTGLFSRESGQVSNGVFAGRRWVKIPVTQAGFYKVDFGQLRNMLVFAGEDSTRNDSLRLFTWPGLPTLKQKDFCDSCDLREVAIGVADDGNGVFDKNTDAIYFNGLAASDWANVYDRAQPDTVFINNPYETRSYYYLTVSTPENPVPGPFKRIAYDTSNELPGGVDTLRTFPARSHQEIDSEYFPHITPGNSTAFWEKWFWQSLNLGSTFIASLDLPGVEPTGPGRLRARLWGVDSDGLCTSTTRVPEHLVDVQLDGTALGRFGWSGRTLPFTIDRPVSGLQSLANSLRIGVAVPDSCFSRIDKIAVAWADLFYRRKLEPVGDELVIESPDSIADLIYKVGPFTTSTPPHVFDVTDPIEPIEMLRFSYGAVGTGYQLVFHAAQTRTRRFRIVPDSKIAKVVTALLTEPTTSLTDLRSTGLRADYLVIYYDGFKAASDSLTNWRNRHDGFETQSFPISAIYDQFSGGRTDPTAIRNFMRAVYRRWALRPTYVTLLGDASYDFKNYKGRALPGQPATLIPSYEDGFDTQNDLQFASDDWLFDVDAIHNPLDIIPDFLSGRIPAVDPVSALSIVRTKVLLYDRATPFGEYRDRVMLVSDDEKQNGGPDPLDWLHLIQTAQLDTANTPPHIDRAYVYLHTYGDRPNDAKDEILDQVNNKGITIFNYVGHGSPFQMTDERIFLDTDVGQLNNADRLPLFVAASCDVGKFSDPFEQSLGERLMLREGGGAIGVISATEVALSTQNAALNGIVYDRIFDRGHVSGTPSYGLFYASMSEALLAAKGGSQNSQKYQLLGDAATRLNLPRLWANVTIYDSSGTTPLTSLPQGKTVMFKGKISYRPPGFGPDSSIAMSGVASVLIEDSAPYDKAPPCTLRPFGICHVCYDPVPPDCRPTYYFRAGPMYRGDVGVTAGSFQGRFVVPMDARPGAHGRIRIYASGTTPTPTDGVGSTRLQVIPGTSASLDQEGPRIALSFEGGSTSVRPDAVLHVTLFDPSGILITDHSPQNSIVVTIDGNTTGRRDISSTFRYAADSYQSGSAFYRLENLTPGPHSIKVSAADNLAAGLNAGVHRSSTTIDFEVADSPPLRISRAYLFPNPTHSGGPTGGGQFVVDALGDSVNVLLRIYTSSGRMIRLLKSSGGNGQVQIPWDGLDDEGDRLANGVYLFKVHASAREDDGSSSAREKAAAEGRFVVLNR